MATRILAQAKNMDALEEAINSSGLDMRAHGRYYDKCKLITVYIVIRRKSPRHSLFCLKVDEETGTAYAVDSEENVLFSTHQDINQPQSPIKLYDNCPSNSACIGEVDGLKLIDQYENSILAFISRLEEAGTVFYNYYNKSGTANCVRTKVQQSFNTVSATIAKQSYSQTQKLLLVVFMLKQYYEEYRLHEQPMPTSIISSLGAMSIVPPASLAIGSRSLILRPACRNTSDSVDYIEVLDNANSEVLFVGKMLQVGRRLELLDECGNLRYFLRYNNYDTNMKDYISTFHKRDGSRLGHHYASPDVFYLAAAASQEGVLHQRRMRGSMNFFSVCSGCQVATAKRENRSAVIKLDIQSQCLSQNEELMILLSSMQSSVSLCKLERQHLIEMDYEFRPMHDELSAQLHHGAMIFQ